jgi:AbrB family looped-hinge helix DNA binding protein
MIMGIVTTSRRGQIVIPKAIRDTLHIGPGKKLTIKAEKDYAVIRPLPDDPVEAFCGVFQARSSLTKPLIEERKKDRIRESKKITR